VYTFSGITIVSRDFELVGDRNSLDDEDVVLFFNLTFYFRAKVPLASGNAARLQRATKGASQSATCGRDNVIECGCAGFGDLWRNIIVFGNFGMHPKVNRCFCRRQVSAPVRPFNPFDADIRNVYNLIAHLLTSCASFVYRFDFTLIGVGISPASSEYHYQTVKSPTVTSLVPSRKRAYLS
jgi:hypothetical protein